MVYINATNSWVKAPGTLNKLHEMQAAGWEISNHTYNHNCSLQNPMSAHMKNWLDANGFPNSGFAAPCNIGIIVGLILLRNTVHIITTATELPGISQPYDLYFIQRINLTNRDNIQTIRGYLDDAVANNKWIIFIAHEFGGTYGDGGTWLPK